MSSVVHGQDNAFLSFISKYSEVVGVAFDGVVAGVASVVGDLDALSKADVRPLLHSVDVVLAHGALDVTYAIQSAEVAGESLAESHARAVARGAWTPSVESSYVMAALELADDGNARSLTEGLITALRPHIVRSILAAVLQHKTPHAAITALQADVKTSRHRFTLAARMAAVTAYNLAAMNAVEALHVEHKGHQWVGMIRQPRGVRLHPIGYASNGRATSPGVPFEVDASDVVLREGRKSVSGVLWKRNGKHWVGATLPASYNDVGRVTPWKTKWGLDPRDERRLHL